MDKIKQEIRDEVRQYLEKFRKEIQSDQDKFQKDVGNQLENITRSTTDTSGTVIKILEKLEYQSERENLKNNNITLALEPRIANNEKRLKDIETKLWAVVSFVILAVLGAVIGLVIK